MRRASISASQLAGMTLAEDPDVVGPEFVTTRHEVPVPVDAFVGTPAPGDEVALYTRDDEGRATGFYAARGRVVRLVAIVEVE